MKISQVTGQGVYVAAALSHESTEMLNAILKTNGLPIPDGDLHMSLLRSFHVNVNDIAPKSINWYGRIWKVRKISTPTAKFLIADILCDQATKYARKMRQYFKNSKGVTINVLSYNDIWHITLNDVTTTVMAITDERMEALRQSLIGKKINFVNEIVSPPDDTWKMSYL